MSQPGRSRSGPPPPHPLPSAPYTTMDLMQLRVSGAGWWTFEDFPSQSQIWPCENLHSLNRLHAALPLCHCPWTLTSRAASALSSVETSGTTAEKIEIRMSYLRPRQWPPGKRWVMKSLLIHVVIILIKLKLLNAFIPCVATVPDGVCPTLWMCLFVRMCVFGTPGGWCPQGWGSLGDIR